MRKFLTYALGVPALATAVAATGLKIQLTGSDPIKEQTISYTCDAHGSAMGLPTGTFQVKYLNGAGNSLAVLPINGKSLVFATVLSASGARYASDKYIWWEAGDRGIHLYSDSVDRKDQTLCQRVK